MAAVNLIKFLDKYVGSLLCLFLSINKLFGRKKVHDYNKILIIQLWGLGESILTLPAIEALRDKYKKKQIDILVTSRNKEVYYKNKSINNVKVLDLNPFSIKLFILKNLKKYDLVIDMEEYLNISSIIACYTGKERIGYSHGIRSNLYTKTLDYNDRQHVVYTFMDLLKPLGIKETVESLPQLNYSKNDKKNIDNLLKKYSIGKKDFIVGLGIGAAESVKERMWPKERFAQVADYLVDKYKAKIILFGNEEESNLAKNMITLMKNKNNAFNFTGKTSVREIFYLIGVCKLFISNDAGPMHVAAAQGVVTIGLFGCNLPIRFKPFGKNNYYIYKKKTQDACINVHKGQVGKCKHGIENACVKKIQVNDVMKIVGKALHKNDK